MPIPLLGKLLSGTGLPYADANQVEVDASGFDGNLETTDVNMQLVAQKVDDLTLGTSTTDPRYRARIALSSDLTITAANIATYDGALLYVNQGKTTSTTVTINVDLNFHFIDFANFSLTNSQLIISPGASASIDGSNNDVTFNQYQGCRLIDEPNAGGSYGIIFSDVGAAVDNYVDSVSYAGNTLTIGRTGSLPDLTATINTDGGGELESLFNAGSALTKGTLVVAFSHTDGSRRMARATTSNVGHNTGPGQLENYIYGFLPENVPANTSARPIRSGLIENYVEQVSNNDPNRRLKITTSGNNYVLSSNNYVAGDYASFAGFVADPDLGSTQDDIVVSLDWVEQSRASRLDAEVAGKEDGLGNPTTDGFVLSSTIAGVRSWVAAGNSGTGFVDTTGTITAGQYPRFTDEDTVEGLDGIPTRDIVLGETILTANGLITVPNESTYTTYVNLRVLFRRASSSGTARIFQLPEITVRNPVFAMTGDFFSIQNDPTGQTNQNMTVRSHNASESLDGTNTFVTLQPNEFITFQIPPVGQTRWILVDRGFVSGTDGVSGQVGSSIDTAMVVADNPFSHLQSWYLDASGETYRNGDVTIEASDMLADDNIRRHVGNIFTNANSPVSSVFDDDQSRVAFWHAMTGDSNYEITDSVNSIRTGIDAAVTHLEATVVPGYDFTTLDPDIDFEIIAITPTGGTNIEIEVASGVDLTTFPQLIVGRRVFIQNSVNANYNGVHIILARSTRHMTISVAGTLNVEGPGAKLNLQWYGRVVVATHASRQYNFNLGHSAHGGNDATFTTNTWNPAYDPNTGTDASALDIDYRAAVIRPSLLKVQGSATIQDQSGVDHLIKHGSYDEIFFYDNVTPNYQNTIDLPGNYRYLYIDTDGIILSARIDATTDQMQDGEARTITVLAADRSSNHHYSIQFRNAATATPENIGSGAYAFFTVQRNNQVEFLLYRNSETDRGIRILTPIERVRPWAAQLTTPTTVTSSSMVLPMGVASIIAAQDEDPGYAFGITEQFAQVAANSYDMIREVEFTFEYNVDVIFNGQEGTGLLFVPVHLTPYINGTPRVEARASTTLLFSRNGQTGSSAPKFQESLFSALHWQATLNDEVNFRLTFGTFPAGYSISDIQIQNATPRITIKQGQG